MIDRTDAALLEALRCGDRAAGVELFERHGEASGQLARRLGAGSDTPDIVQDVWMQILRAPPVLRGESLDGWLATTIRNRVMQHRRKATRVDPLSSRHAPHTPGTTPTQRVEHEEQLQRVWAAIEAGDMSSEELRLLTMRYSMTSAEAGVELGIPASTYRDRTRRVLHKLARIVGLS